MSCGPVREGMKTIRQIADEIGVSKTAVNKQIANLGLRSGLRKNGNQFAIDEQQEALIKQAFSEKTQTEIENQTQTKTQTGSLMRWPLPSRQRQRLRPFTLVPFNSSSLLEREKSFNRNEKQYRVEAGGSGYLKEKIHDKKS